MNTKYRGGSRLILWPVSNKKKITWTEIICKNTPWFIKIFSMFYCCRKHNRCELVIVIQILCKGKLASCTCKLKKKSDIQNQKQVSIRLSKLWEHREYWVPKFNEKLKTQQNMIPGVGLWNGSCPTWHMKMFRCFDILDFFYITSKR